MTPYITVPAWVIPLAVNALILLSCYMDWHISRMMSMAPWKDERAKIILVAVVSSLLIWMTYAGIVAVLVSSCEIAKESP